MSDQSDAASELTVFSRKEIDMTISIVTLGLLFLFLTVMYIWITLRFRVQTNNRHGETQNVYGNSTI
jgi:heme/copper-type cytochrome/quinol oxidase subunit 2